MLEQTNTQECRQVKGQVVELVGEQVTELVGEQVTEQVKEYKAFHGSKRIVGAVCVSVGLVFLLSVGIAAIFKKLADPEIAVQVGGYIFFAGCGLLGLTAVEDLRGIFGK
jgi:hypothetical protein